MVRAFFEGALILTIMDGDELPLPTNVDAVKKYFALKSGIIKVAKLKT